MEPKLTIEQALASLLSECIDSLGIVQKPSLGAIRRAQKAIDAFDAGKPQDDQEGRVWQSPNCTISGLAGGPIRIYLITYSDHQLGSSYTTSRSFKTRLTDPEAIAKEWCDLHPKKVMVVKNIYGGNIEGESTSPVPVDHTFPEVPSNQPAPRMGLYLK